ncbi:hypothetical protein PLESTM_001242300 [Pleodorina starrii]|nr:hypothetical protein PLESTM_001242300 [Pleodorina starrii]
MLARPTSSAGGAAYGAYGAYEGEVPSGAQRPTSPHHTARPGQAGHVAGAGNPQQSQMAGMLAQPTSSAGGAAYQAYGAYEGEVPSGAQGPTSPHHTARPGQAGHVAGAGNPQQSQMAGMLAQPTSSAGGAAYQAYGGYEGEVPSGAQRPISPHHTARPGQAGHVAGSGHSQQSQVAGMMARPTSSAGGAAYGAYEAYEGEVPSGAQRPTSPHHTARPGQAGHVAGAGNPQQSQMAGMMARPTSSAGGAAYGAYGGYEGEVPSGAQRPTSPHHTARPGQAGHVAGAGNPQQSQMAGMMARPTSSAGGAAYQAYGGYEGEVPSGAQRPISPHHTARPGQAGHVAGSGHSQQSQVAGMMARPTSSAGGAAYGAYEAYEGEVPSGAQRPISPHHTARPGQAGHVAGAGHSQQSQVAGMMARTTSSAGGATYQAYGGYEGEVPSGAQRPISPHRTARPGQAGHVAGAGNAQQSQVAGMMARTTSSAGGATYEAYGAYEGEVPSNKQKVISAHRTARPGKVSFFAGAGNPPQSRLARRLIQPFTARATHQAYAVIEDAVSPNIQSAYDSRGLQRGHLAAKPVQTPPTSARVARGAYKAFGSFDDLVTLSSHKARSVQRTPRSELRTQPVSMVQSALLQPGIQPHPGGPATAFRTNFTTPGGPAVRPPVPSGQALFLTPDLVGANHSVPNSVDNVLASDPYRQRPQQQLLIPATQPIPTTTAPFFTFIINLYNYYTSSSR